MTDKPVTLMGWYNGTSGAWRKTVLAATIFYYACCVWINVTFGFVQSIGGWVLGFIAWGTFVWMLKNLVHAAMYRALRQLSDEEEAKQQPPR